MANIHLVQSASRYLVIIAGSIILLLGLVGNGLLICVFSQRKGKFRKSPCALYIVSMSVIKTLHLVHILVYLIISIGFGIDPTLTSLVYCKLRYYLAQATMPHISLTLECAATISQFLVTSRQRAYREKISYKVVRICILFILLFWCLQAIPYLILYKIKITLETKKPRCDSFNTALNHYTTWFLRIATIFICTCTILPLFGYLTLRNIRRLTQNSNRQQQIERQMSLMLIVQIAFYVIGCIPFGIFSVYILITETVYKSPERKAIEGLISTILYLLVNSTMADSFVFINKWRHQTLLTFHYQSSVLNKPRVLNGVLFPEPP